MEREVRGVAEGAGGIREPNHNKVYQARQKELEGVVNPIMMKVYQPRQKELQGAVSGSYLELSGS